MEGKRGLLQRVSGSSGAIVPECEGSGDTSDLVNAVLSRLQEDGGASGYDQDDTQIDDGRQLPEDFPKEYVAEREKVVRVVMGCREPARHDDVERSMQAEFVHQVLDRDRFVLGYKNLSILIRYTTLWRALLEIKYDDKLLASKWGDDLLDQDILEKVLKSAIRPDHGGERSFTTDPETFAQWVKEDRSCVEERMAALVASNNSVLSRFAGLPVKRLVTRKVGNQTLEILQADKLANSEEGRAILSRCQAMSLWWVESSEQTDATDPRWSILVALLDGELAGFTSLFTFTNPMREQRPLSWRICQSIVRPGLQRRGIGRSMAEIVYTNAEECDRVFEITVEDPCLAFTALRDLIEVARCRPHLLGQHGDRLAVFENGIVPRDVALRVREKALVTLKQVQRCYEILKLGESRGDAASEKFDRLNIKRRMWNENIEGIRERPRAELRENLGMLYDDLVAQYETVLQSQKSKASQS